MFKHKAVWLSLVSLLLLFSMVSGCIYLQPPVESKAPTDLGVVNEAWDLIFKEHVDRDKLDKAKISQGAIRGMIEALDDPYSAYLTPEVYETQVKRFQGAYQGIGAYISERDKELVFVATIPGSPAEKAGMRPGDKLLEINGESTAGMTSMEAALKIQGPAGTEVKLLILHEGETEPVVLTIVRAEIEIKTVSMEMREDIAYIRIVSFSLRTAVELSSVLEQLPASATGIILDLRNNPGGTLDTVVEVCGQFIKSGVVVRVVNNEGKETILEVKGGGKITDLPVVVLVNKNSASGSEVLAGAFQDHGRARVAGTKTYGKGSVNTLQPLRDGSALYLTIARWLTPNGRPIEGVGITPDIPLELEGEELVKWAIEYLHSQQKAGASSIMRDALLPVLS